MNFGRCVGCSNSIELSIAEERKTGESLTDLNVVSSYQSPSTPPATVAVLLLSPRLSGLSPHAARVPQPSRPQEGAQGLPCCAETKNEKVQLLEIIGKEKGAKQEAASRKSRADGRKGPRFGNWVTASSLGRLHSDVRVSEWSLYSGHPRASYSTRLFLAGLHSLVVLAHGMPPLLTPPAWANLTIHPVIASNLP
jgi:hypothetical protein